MLVNHEIDVASVTRAFSRESNIIDRSTQIRAESGDWSKVKPLFPDRVAEATRFVKQHGFAPANHAYAIRGDVARKYPWLAFNLYKAFVAAKAGVARSLRREFPVRACFLAENMPPRRARFSATIRIPTASKPTGRCSKRLIDYSSRARFDPAEAQRSKICSRRRRWISEMAQRGSAMIRPSVPLLDFVAVPTVAAANGACG